MATITVADVKQIKNNCRYDGPRKSLNILEISICAVENLRKPGQKQRL